MWILAVFLFLAILGLALSWFGLFTQRPMARYAEETRAQTYDKSRQYNQGVNRDVARYCEQMRRETTDSGKRATAALIRSTTSTFEGDLNQDNHDCVTDAKGL